MPGALPRSALALVAVPLLLGVPNAAPPSCNVYELGVQSGFPTGDWLLYQHQELCRPDRSYLYARQGKETRRLRSTRDLLALVPALHNEVEALALAAFLTDQAALWSDFHCAAVPLRTSARAPVQASPAAARGAQAPRATPDSGDEAEPVPLEVPDQNVAVDPSSISVSREGPAGPFVVQRYLRCPAKGGRIVLSRETFGPGSRYARQDVRTIAPEVRR